MQRRSDEGSGSSRQASAQVVHTSVRSAITLPSANASSPGSLAGAGWARNIGRTRSMDHLAERVSRGPTQQARSGPSGPAAANPRRGRQASGRDGQDRKSTRLNSSHVKSSYAVFCLKKKKNEER